MICMERGGGRQQEEQIKSGEKGIYLWDISLCIVMRSIAERIFLALIARFEFSAFLNLNSSKVSVPNHISQPIAAGQFCKRILRLRIEAHVNG